MFVKKFRKSISNLLRIESLIEKNLTVQSLRNSTLTSSELAVNNNLILDKPIVVSMTTYGKKIYDIYLVVESIMQQTMKPQKIVLWLSNEHFNEDNIPLILKKQCKRGLEIRFCKDIGPHTKLIPALENYFEYHIITVDDDMLYPIDMIERFSTAYKADPHKIYFNKGHKIILDKNGKILPYLKWCKSYKVDESSLTSLPLGVYGVFYSTGSLSKEVLNEEVFSSICPKADDVWFKAMSLLKETECKLVDKGAGIGNNFISIEENRERALARTNVDEGLNDIQIKAVFTKYNLYNTLLK